MQGFGTNASQPPMAGSSDLAAEWWTCHGCPERKKLAAELVEAAAV